MGGIKTLIGGGPAPVLRSEGLLANKVESPGDDVSGGHRVTQFPSAFLWELEDLNLHAKEQRKNRVDAATIQEERLKYLTDEKRIKAVTVMFSDLEGRLHMLDYDKKFPREELG
jgi:hypothetical protein